MKKISDEEYEKALDLVGNYIMQCSRCGDRIGDRWEYAANSFSISLNVDCCSTEAIWGSDHNRIGFNHPAIEKGATFQGMTLKGSSKGKYRLCPRCNRGLMKIIGDYIKK